MKQSSSTLKKLSMELGGNAPIIVFEDAKLDLAVEQSIASKFRSLGQTCVCANRIYVQRGVYDEFIKKFAEKVENFKIGNGFEKGVTHGCVINQKSIQKVEDHLQDALQKVPNWLLKVVDFLNWVKTFMHQQLSRMLLKI